MSMTPPPPPGSPPPPPPPAGDFPVIGPVSPAGQPLADPWMRILARALDVVILLVLIGLVATPIVLSDVDDDGFGGLGGDVSAGQQFAVNLVGLVLIFLWDVLCPKMFGGSPMKLAFGMRIVRAADGGPIGWSHAFLRVLPTAVLSIIPVVGFIGRIVLAIVGIVFLFTKPLRQTVSDLVAKTLVVKKVR